MVTHAFIHRSVLLWFFLGCYLVGVDLSAGRVSPKCTFFSGNFAVPHSFPISVKTKVQTRALAGERKRGVWETFHRLVRGESSERLLDSPALLSCPCTEVLTITASHQVQILRIQGPFSREWRGYTGDSESVR